MRKLVKTTFALCLLGLGMQLSPAVQAEEKTEQIAPAQVAGIPFNKYVQTSGYLASLQQTINDYEMQFGDCAAAAYDARMQIGQPQKPISFPGKSETVPQWIEVARVEGCEQPYVRGVLVALLDGNISFHPLLKGNGVSGIFTQKVVLGKLLEKEKAEAKKAGCAEKDDVRITQHDMVDKSKTVAAGSWDEVWHIKNCKGPKFVQVTFTAKDEGTADFKFQDVIMREN